MSIKKNLKKVVKKVAKKIDSAKKKRRLKKEVKKMEQSASMAAPRATIPNTQTKKQFQVLNATEAYRKSKGLELKRSINMVDGSPRVVTEAFMPPAPVESKK